MRNFKKIVAMTLVATSTLSLAACGNKNEESDSGKKTITIAWWGSEDRNNATQAAIDKYNAAHDDIEVKVSYNAWSGYEDKIATQFASKTQADINQINWAWIDTYDNGDLFLDINTVSSKFDLTQYDQTYLDQCTVDGSLKAIPVSVTGRIFYWNTAKFEEAGIATPTTLDELLQAGNTFKEKLGEDYYPLALGELDRTILMVYYLESVYGKEWVTNGTLNFTEEEIAEGYKFIQTLEENHVTPTIKQLIGDGAESLDQNAKWTNGNYAGIFEWDSSASKFQKALANEYQDKFEVGDEIKFGDANGGFSKISLAFAISANTKYPEECAELLNYLLNEEEGVTELGLQRGTPLSKSALTVLESAGVLEGDMVTEANKKVLSFVQFGMDPTFEDTKLKGSTGTYYTTMQNLSYGDQTAEDAAKTLVSAINDLLN